MSGSVIDSFRLEIDIASPSLAVLIAALYVPPIPPPRRFRQTLSVNGDPLDLFDQPLLLDMIFLGTPQLCGGVYILFFFKVSFEKHPSAGDLHAFLGGVGIDLHPLLLQSDHLEVLD